MKKVSTVKQMEDNYKTRIKVPQVKNMFDYRWGNWAKMNRSNFVTTYLKIKKQQEVQGSWDDGYFCHILGYIQSFKEDNELENTRTRHVA